jgi:hypothetical protein
MAINTTNPKLILNKTNITYENVPKNITRDYFDEQYEFINKILMQEIYSLNRYNIKECINYIINISNNINEELNNINDLNYNNNFLSYDNKCLHDINVELYNKSQQLFLEKKQSLLY